MSPLVSNAVTYVGQSWPAYALLISAVPMKAYPKARRHNRVTPNTDLCIEGPAGSGNSYFVTAFALANPTFRIAHHHHVASQITRAVRLAKPTIALLRHPLDCVTSRAGGSPHLIGAMYHQWIRFFRAVDACGDGVIIGRFETVTADPGEFVRYVNERSGTAFCDAIPEAEAVFQAMDESYSRHLGIRHRNPNRPNSERERRREPVRLQAGEHELAPVAAALYDRLSHRAR